MILHPFYSEGIGIEGRLVGKLAITPSFDYPVLFLIYSCKDNALKLVWRELIKEDSYEMYAKLRQLSKTRETKYPKTMEEAVDIPGGREIIDEYYPQRERFLSDHETEMFNEIVKGNLPHKVTRVCGFDGHSYLLSIIETDKIIEYYSWCYIPRAWKTIFNFIESVVTATNLDRSTYGPLLTSEEYEKTCKQLEECARVRYPDEQN